jgi:hypothetical protein
MNTPVDQQLRVNIPIDFVYDVLGTVSLSIDVAIHLAMML